MKGNIIALRGKAGCGKTTTIGLVQDHLNGRVEEPRFVRIYHEEFGRRRKGRRKDFHAIFQFKEIKIGISSFGDRAIEVENAVKKFIAQGCQIIVCACHPPRSKTVQELKDWEAKGWIVSYVEKSVSTNEGDEDTFNERDATEIAQLIMTLAQNG